MQPKKGVLPPQFAKKKKGPITAAQAKKAATYFGKKPTMPTNAAALDDAEDLKDGGADEAKEKS